jgi:hypothetical protein
VSERTNIPPKIATYVIMLFRTDLAAWGFMGAAEVGGGGV